MIRASRGMVLICATAALALHAAGLWVSDPQAEIEIKGGTGDVEAMLGSSFADMVAGAAQPVSDSTVTPNRQSDQVVEPTQPGEALRSDTPESAQTAPPPPRRPSPPAPRRAEPAPSERTPAQATATIAAAEAVAPVQSATAIEPAVPEATSKPIEDIDIARKPAPTNTDRPEVSRVPEVPKKVIEATPEDRHGLQVSRRPQSRPREIEEAAAARQAPEPERKTEVRGNSGSNAARDASRGSTAGRQSATAARQGRNTRSRSTEQGNAATSNYPGEVMRHLARVPRPRANARGAAMVQFSIADGGRLASARLGRSSGSTRLDRAALTVVRRAAPFPAPPRGAQRSFSVKIEGR